MSTRSPENGWKRGFYRSRKGVFFGVCRGLADYFDCSTFWLRAAFVLAALLTVFWPVVIAYVVLALVMKPGPVAPFQDESDREFYESYVSSRELAMNRLRRTYEALDRRVQRMESIVTSRDFEWQQRMGK